MYMGKNKKHFHRENTGERTGKAHNKMEDNKVENPEEAVQPQDEVIEDAVNSTPVEDAAAEEAVAVAFAHHNRRKRLYRHGFMGGKLL